MAGFFGLFNYEKEGPGISKNAPKNSPDMKHQDNIHIQAAEQQ